MRLPHSCVNSPGYGGGGTPTPAGSMTGDLSRGAPSIYFNVVGAPTGQTPIVGTDYILHLNGTSIGRHTAKAPGTRVGDGGEWSFHDTWAEVEDSDLDGVDHTAIIDPLIGTTGTLTWTPA